jgi:hypothetical protein
MKLSLTSLIRGLLLGWLFIPACALACEPEQDGCLGCNDDELPVCLGTLIHSVCDASINPANCDTHRIYDDAERYVMINTGNHMSRVRAMFRSPRRYQLH